MSCARPASTSAPESPCPDQPKLEPGTDGLNAQFHADRRPVPCPTVSPSPGRAGNDTALGVVGKGSVALVPGNKEPPRGAGALPNRLPLWAERQAGAMSQPYSKASRSACRTAASLVSSSLVAFSVPAVLMPLSCSHSWSSLTRFRAEPSWPLMRVQGLTPPSVKLLWVMTCPPTTMVCHWACETAGATATPARLADVARAAMVVRIFLLSIGVPPSRRVDDATILGPPCARAQAP